MLQAVMQAGPSSEAARSSPPGGKFLERFCLPFLRDSQNTDGGWGYQPGAQSAVEPTCWALVALSSEPRSLDLAETVRRGSNWLSHARLRDGSWPAQMGQQEGCWVTSLAGLALAAHSIASDEVAAAVRWVCDAWPAEGSWWWRARHRLFGRSDEVRQNFALRGWSWTPGTSSWVEPTCFALILLHNTPAASHPPLAAKRRRLGEAMLYDRMCPGGGWNCGNPRDYGVPGQPLAIQTSWALLALRAYEHRVENQQSLAWLEGAYGQLQGPASLAAAQLCLHSYGRRAPTLEPALERLYSRNQFLQNVVVVSWAAMALNPKRNLFRPTEGNHT